VRIRHVAVCTADPWGTEARVQALLQLAVVQRDVYNPSIGIRNGVFALQDTFLEITTPAGPATATQRFLDKHGDGGYMVCLQVDDLARARSRVEDRGVRVVLEINGHRSGDQSVSAVHLHPQDTGGTLFSLEEANPRESWAYAGEAWKDYRRGDIVRNIVGVEIASARPDALAIRLADLFDVENKKGVIELCQSRIVVIAGSSADHRDRLRAIEFQATNRSRKGDQHTVAGTIFRFV